MRTVRAEYELQPELLDLADALAEALGPDATVEPLPSAIGGDLPPDGLLIELQVEAEDPFAAVQAAAVRLADAFRAVDLPIRAVSLEAEGLLPVRIETLPRITPYTG
ncbi:MAG: hypothetical protein RJQ03_03330 [Miltoncostaeaceae bacterium]